MSGFNLSEWALRHRALVIFAMVVSVFAGLSAYFALGRAEDPSFTVKTMVIRVAWPGASAREMETQVTDEIERALQEAPNFDYVSSYSRPGEATLFVWLRDDTPPAEVPDSWYQVRKRVGDIRPLLPSGIVGPYFNDDFGDTFGSIYAFRSDGFDDSEMKRVLLSARQRLLRLPDVSKVELWGVQEQRFFVEFETARLAELGLAPQAILDSLARQNAVTPSGTIEAPTTRIRLNVTGAVDSVEAIAGTPIAVDGRQFRLGDVATVTRGFADPPVFSMRWNGERVTALAVSMVEGGDILALGENLAREMEAIQAALPAGIDIEKVSDQPYVVEHSVAEFELHFVLALGIVLGVSFLSLGWRAGMVVALSVPLVLAITFVIMDLGGLDLHRISLGALIIALGLLVDDAIIAVEMILVKLEEGWDRFRAASFAWTSTAFPMLTGTLITAAGFVPVGFARSGSGEYTNAIFWVVGISLVVSWIVAVLFTPYLGYKLLPAKAAGHGTHGYDGKLYRRLRSAVDWCVSRRKLTLGLTVGAFVASLAAFPFVPQQFFPSSSREEVLIDLELAEGSSYAATLAAARTLERLVRRDPRTEDVVSYVGGGGPRFYLALNPELPNLAFAQFIAKPKKAEDSVALARDLDAKLKAAMPDVRVRVSRLENGPPVGYPVQFRVMGPDPDTVRTYAAQVRDTMRTDPRMRDVNFQWFERTKALQLVVDQERARALGLTPQDVSQTLQTLLSGYTVTQVRDRSELIDVVARAAPDERAMAERINELSIRVPSGGSVPLDQVARIVPELEDGVVWRRNRDASLIVRGDVIDGVQGPDVSGALNEKLDAVRDRMPAGYRIEMGGAVEEAAKGSASIFKLFPVMLGLWLTLLMIQLQSFSRMTMVFLTAPLGLIGVVFALLLFQAPFGFVAQLGVIALAGMIMRNSVILVDQIDRDIADGAPAWTAIVEATVRRARPVVLTALAAILAMIPLTWSTFWGPMAIAIMGGLAVATVLTLFFVPALCALWFRVRREPAEPSTAAPPAAEPVPAT
ncbi:efflux RND transporter permease subunit [Sphingomonas parva]|uniref:Efflux RND transporter permease subunit n=1 Tax=Sphingomonas parva TaxID=2555898 RepID=A0A4Y8ZQH0_9SPHN|nr:efflux RND transporter permease subunit [Sphingomonas parva]TFI58270.1 efflux RND transporter permease subunit [Sphingomonas parva]